MGCRAQRNLLQLVLDYANGMDLTVIRGTVYADTDRPLIHFPRVLDNLDEPDLAHLRYLLDALSRYADDNLPVVVNDLNNRTGQWAMIVPGKGIPVAVPYVHNSAEIPWAILAIALTTDFGNGIPLGCMVGKCRLCKKYFVAKTRRKSAYCGTVCRYRDGNLKKKKGGDAPRGAGGERITVGGSRESANGETTPWRVKAN